MTQRTATVISEPLTAFEEDQLAEAASMNGPREIPDGLELPDTVHYKETTYFWHVEDGPDRDYCRAYVQELYPYSQAMVVSELLIPRLNPSNNLIILSRPNPRRHPIMREFRAPDTGYRLTEPLPLEKCLEGIMESPVIEVAPFITGASRYAIGKFNSNAFFDLCSQYMYGGHMRIQEKEQTIRFLAG